jgi:multisubunit Na+/H+ antiporter MnhG subunit
LALCPKRGGPVRAGDRSNWPCAVRNETGGKPTKGKGFRIEDIQEYWDRPEGIGILAVLTALDGGLAVAFGALGLIRPSAFSMRLLASSGSVTGPLSLALLLVGMALGLVLIWTGWGLWGGRGWAWKVLLWESVISLVAYSFSSIQDLWDLGEVAFNLIVIYYLFRPNVRGYFGRLPKR